MVIHWLKIQQKSYNSLHSSAIWTGLNKMCNSSEHEIKLILGGFFPKQSFNFYFPGTIQMLHMFPLI